MVRLLDEAGNPEPASSIVADFVDAADRTVAWLRVPVVDGRARATVSLRAEEEVRTLRWWRFGMRVGVVATPLPEPDAGGVRDCGTARFERGDVVCAGRVVDDVGAPVPRVLVSLALDLLPGALRRCADFVTHPARDTRPAADGTFVIRSYGVRVPEFVEVNVDGGLHAPRRVQVRRGSQDLEIVVPRLGSLVARLAPAASGRTLPLLRGRVAPHRTEGGGWRRHYEDLVGRAGTFVAEGLEPGLYDVCFSEPLKNGWAPQLIVRGIEVPPGAASTDARLGALRIPDLGPPAFIEVVDDFGRMIPGAVVLPADDGVRVQAWNRDLVKVRFGETPSNLIVASEDFGHRAQIIRGVDGSRRVTLRRGPAIRVTSAPSELPPHVELVVRWRPSLDVAFLGRPAPGVDWSFRWPIADGVTRTTAGPGLHRWGFEVSCAGEPPNVCGVSWNEGTFEVHESADGSAQNIELRIPQAALDDALSHLAEQRRMAPGGVEWWR
ncbi:MAG TPA: hypothetical protein VEI02_07445 [Planctomycetota bacterium]|nr:hypothetical protein [Planctomycetota bacterium]